MNREEPPAGRSDHLQQDPRTLKPHERAKHPTDMFYACFDEFAFGARDTHV